MLPALISLLLACAPHPGPSAATLAQRGASLQARSSPDRLLVLQSASPANALGFVVDPTGTQALSVGDDGLGTVWDLRSGAVLAHAAADLRGASALAWTRQGVLWVDGARRLRLLEPPTWTVEDRWLGDVTGLSVSPDGAWALVAHAAGRVDLLELDTGRLHAAGPWFGELALGWMGPDRALVGGDGVVHVLERRGGAFERGADVAIPGRVRAIGGGVSPVIATGSRLYTLGPSLEPVFRTGLPRGALPVSVTAWPGGMVAATVERAEETGRAVLIWPAGADDPVEVAQGVAITALGGEGALVTLADGGARILRLGEYAWELRASPPSAVPVQVGGRWALTAGAEGGLALWDLSSGRAARSWVSPGVRATALSADGQWAAAAREDGNLDRWSIPDGRPAPLGLNVPDVASLAVADDGALIVGGGDGQLWIAPSDGSAPTAIRVSRAGPVLVSARPDGRMAAAAGADGAVLTVIVRTATVQREDRSLRAEPRAVLMSPDGERTYMAGGLGAEGGIWRLDEGRLRPIHPPQVRGPVTALTLAPNGRDLVFATADGQLCTLYRPDERDRHSACFHDVDHPLGPLDLYTSLGLVGGSRPLLLSGGLSGLTQVWRWDARPTFAATLASAAEGEQVLWAVADGAGRVEASWTGDVDFVHRVNGARDRATPLSAVGSADYVRGLLGKVLQGAHLPALSPEREAPELVLLDPLVGAGSPEGSVCVLNAAEPSVQVRLNGRQVGGATRLDQPCEGGAGQAGQAFGISLPSSELAAPVEDAIVEVSAQDGATGLRSPELRLAITPSLCASSLHVEPARAYPTALREDRGLKAVIVGTSDYPGSDRPLSWPANDADKLKAGLLIGAAALPGLTVKPEDVVLLKSDGTSGEPLATKPKILEAIQAAADSATASDTLLLYLSGHGAADHGEWYYALSGFPVDGDLPPSADPQHTLSSAEIRGLLAGTRAREVVLILDTCEAGAAADRIAEEAVGAGLDWGATYVLAASGYGPAFESDRLQQGLLTWSLLDVLSQGDHLLKDGNWDLNVVLPLASQGVLDLGERLGMGALETPVVARPRLDRPLTIGKTPEDFREQISLSSPMPRLGAPMLLDARTLVDLAGLSGLLEDALRPLAQASEGGFTLDEGDESWRVGGLYYGGPERRCLDLRVYEGDEPRGEARIRGADSALAAQLAPWISGCLDDGACEPRLSDPAACP